jgi:hypothetical protein
MKTKKRTFRVLLLSLLVSLCALCFSTVKLINTYAESNTVAESTVTTENEAVVEVTEKWNDKVKNWLGTILGSAGVIFDTLLVVLLSKKDNKKVTVTVNDSTTQTKLDALQVEYGTIKKLLIDMFQLNKGTMDVLLTLFSSNKSLDANIRDTIKSISLNSEEVLKDVSDILKADNHKAAKTALQNISNIVLG